MSHRILRGLLLCAIWGAVLLLCVDLRVVVGKSPAARAGTEGEHPPVGFEAEGWKGDIPIGEEKVDRWTPLPRDYVPSDLVILPEDVRVGRPLRMRREAAEAFTRMIREARKEGIEITIISAYRSYDHQRKLYIREVKKSGPKQRSVAKPGHSEHQLGTTADVVGKDWSKALKPSFAETPEFEWIRTNSRKFGIIVSYTPENQAEIGYIPEPWHLRYIGDSIRGRRDDVTW
ncbi:MAG: M15 family metallopeptidase [bacterium]